MKDNYKYQGQRKRLSRLLANKGITDERILKAVEIIPRHFFLDTAFQEHAYDDKPFPIGEGQTISQPFTVAYQTQVLEVKPGNRLLEIGTGSGYQACILAELGAEVHTIERLRPLYERFKKLLPYLRYDIKLYCGDGSLGLPDQAPFDRILVTAAAPKIPPILEEQLAAGGIMIIPVGTRSIQRMIKLYKSQSGKIKYQELDRFRFVPLLGRKGWDQDSNN